VLGLAVALESIGRAAREISLAAAARADDRRDLRKLSKLSILRAVWRDKDCRLTLLGAVHFERDRFIAGSTAYSSGSVVKYRG
jgi:hypothetical protein